MGGISLCATVQGHCSADSRIFPVFAWELKLSVSAIKGYRAALDHVFSLACVDLAANCMINRFFHSFEKLCLLREIKPPNWNLFLVIRNLTYLPYEPLKLSSDMHLSCKTCFLLALRLAKRVSELYGFPTGFVIPVVGVMYVFLLSRHCSQDPEFFSLDSRFRKFSILSLDDSGW